MAHGDCRSVRDALDKIRSRSELPEYGEDSNKIIATIHLGDLPWSPDCVRIHVLSWSPSECGFGYFENLSRPECSELGEFHPSDYPQTLVWFQVHMPPIPLEEVQRRAEARMR